MAIEGEVTGRWDEGQGTAREREPGEHGNSECPRPLVVLLPAMPRWWGGNEGPCYANTEHGTSRC